MGWAEKRNGNWRARWLDREGRQRSSSGFRTREAALEYADIRERFREPDATLPPAEEQVISNDYVVVRRFPDGTAAVTVMGNGPRVFLRAHEWNGLCEIIRALDGKPRTAAPVRSRA